jgi:hypothetical protein
MHELIRFVRRRWQEILVTGVFLQSVIAGIYTFDPIIAIASSIGGLALLVVVFEGVSRLQARRHRPQRGESVAFQVPRRAIVFTVGHQTFTIEQALAAQEPDYVGILCTQQTERVAESIISAHDLLADRYKKEIVDPHKIVEVRRKTEFIINWVLEQGVAREEIVVDVTGGLTPMSLGAFSVAEDRRIDSQYITSDYADNQPVPGTQQAILIGRYSDVPGTPGRTPEAADRQPDQ